MSLEEDSERQALPPVSDPTNPDDANTDYSQETIDPFLDIADPQQLKRSPPPGPPGEVPLPTTPPSQVPNHDLIRCLGAGGFGQVWLAKQRLTQHYRACKLIVSHKAVELDGLRRLKQRVPAHPNLFPIDDVGEAEGWMYCLMPLADNAASDQAMLEHSAYEPLTLTTYLKRHGRRPCAEAARLGLELAQAIKHLHAHGVTHGDIKPDNILRLSGQWTLADYGLARDLAKPTGGGCTPAYSPPEGPGSVKADQFALGVVLMQVLLDWPATMLAEFMAQPINKLELADGGGKLVPVIRQIVDHEQTRRFGSMDELIEALRRFTVHKRSLRPAFIAAGIALLLGGGITLLANPFNQAPAETPVVTQGTPLDVAATEAPSLEVHFQREDQTGSYQLLTPELLPLNTGDRVQIHVKLPEPMYAAVAVVTASGEVAMIYPQLQADEQTKPVSSFQIPPSRDQWLPLEPPAGTETLVLLASREPLEGLDAIRDDLQRIKAPPIVAEDGLILADARGVRLQMASGLSRDLGQQAQQSSKGFIDQLLLSAEGRWGHVRVLAFPHGSTITEDGN